MAKLLSWATDVLQAVDQSAATISQKDRRKGVTEGTVSDGNASASDSVWSEGEAPHTGYSSEGLKGRNQSAATATAGTVPPDALAAASPIAGIPKASPISSLRQSRRFSQDSLSATVTPTKMTSLLPTSSDRADASSAGIGTPVASPALKSVAGTGSASGSPAIGSDRTRTDSLAGSSPFKAPIDPFSALFAAKTPSEELAHLRAMRRQLEGRVWVNAGKRAEFEEDARKASEAEAQVSILVKAMEQLQQAAAHATAAHVQQKENLNREQLGSRAALVKEQSSFATSKAEWDMRRRELVEEAESYTRALEGTKKQQEERARETANVLEAVKALDEEESKLRFLLQKQVEQEQQEEAKGHQGQGQEEEGMGAECVSGAVGDGESGECSRGGGAMGGKGGKGEERAAAGEGTSPFGLASPSATDKDELEFWRERVGQLQQQLKLASQKAVQLDRAGAGSEREKNLGLRIRSMGEQLLIKQSQAEELATEVQAQRLRLEHVLGEKSRLRAMEEAAESQEATAVVGSGGKVNSRWRRRRPGWHSSTDNLPEVSSGAPGRRRLNPYKLMRVARRSVDSLSQLAGALLAKSTFNRIVAVAYVFSLHLVALAILSLVVGQHKHTAHLTLD